MDMDDAKDTPHLGWRVNYADHRLAKGRFFILDLLRLWRIDVNRRHDPLLLLTVLAFFVKNASRRTKMVELREITPLVQFVSFTRTWLDTY